MGPTRECSVRRQCNLSHAVEWHESPRARGGAWKSTPPPAHMFAPMGLNDHQQALKAAEQRVESLKVSL